MNNTVPGQAIVAQRHAQDLLRALEALQTEMKGQFQAADLVSEQAIGGAILNVSMLTLALAAIAGFQSHDTKMMQVHNNLWAMTNGKRSPFQLGVAEDGE